MKWSDKKKADSNLVAFLGQKCIDFDRILNKSSNLYCLSNKTGFYQAQLETLEMLSGPARVT